MPSQRRPAAELSSELLVRTSVAVVIVEVLVGSEEFVLVEVVVVKSAEAVGTKEEVVID